MSKCKTILLATLLVSANIAGCGGGSTRSNADSNASGTGVNPGGPQQPTKQLFLSDKVLAGAGSISSQGASLYVGTECGLVEIDPTTGAKRAVAGCQIDMIDNKGTQAGGPKGLFDPYSGSAFVSLHPNYEAKMSTVSLSPSYSAPDIAIPRAALRDSGPNFRGMTANDERAFWMGFDGNSIMNVYTEVYGQADSYKKIASVTAEDGAMATSGDYLYLYTDKPATPTRMIYRYQISTGSLSAVQQPRVNTTAYTLNFPLVTSPNGVFWAEGSNIYFLDNTKDAARQIGSVASTVARLAISGNFLYALHWESSSTVIPTWSMVVTRFDVRTLMQTEMIRHDATNIQTAQIYGTESGHIFLAEDVRGSGINISEITGPNTLRKVVNLSAYGLQGMYVSPTALAVSAMAMGTSSYQVFRYNLTSAITDQIGLPIGSNYLKGVGESLFIADYPGNLGIMKLELNKPLNIPVPLQPSATVNSSWSQGGTLSDGNLYWIGFQFPVTGPVYQLETSKTDGANFAVLLQTSGELRDPTVINGRVYFLCKDNCGAEGWVMASTTPTGADQQLELVIGGVNPRLYEYGSNLYMTVSDGNASSIISLNTSTLTWDFMVSRIPYTTLYLDFSSKWLYWSGESVNGNGTPGREIARQAWIDWNHVDTKQQIEWGSGIGVVDGLYVGSMHYFAGNLYYWNDGLIRVSE